VLKASGNLNERVKNVDEGVHCNYSIQIASYQGIKYSDRISNFMWANTYAFP